MQTWTSLDLPKYKPQRQHRQAGTPSKLFPHSSSLILLQDQILQKTNLLLRAGSDPDEEDMNQGFRMAPGRGQGLVYIGQSINSRPSDQTDLKEQRRCNLGGSGEPTFEGEADRQALCFGGLPSGVFQSLPMSVSLWINVIYFNEQVRFSR